MTDAEFINKAVYETGLFSKELAGDRRILFSLQRPFVNCSLPVEFLKKKKQTVVFWIACNILTLTFEIASCLTGEN